MKSTGQSGELVEIVGVVHPLGAGGGRGGQESLWALNFSFVLWRRPDGAVTEQQLYLSKPGLTDAELRAAMDALHPYDIIRVRVRPTEPVGAGDTARAQLVEVLGPEPSDTELSARVEQLRQPVTVEHPFFGTLTLDRALNSYEAEVPWGGHPVRLHLSLDESEDENALLATAQSLWDEQRQWDERVRDHAADELLDLKNDAWLGEDEEPFTRDTFKARMALASVGVYSDGAFEFCFNDGNLFWGHVILVSGSLAEGPKDASIAG